MLSNASGRQETYSVHCQQETTREELKASWLEMWGNSAALNNQRPCWSEEAVSSELRERLDRWSTKNFKSSMNYVKNGYERVLSIDIMVTGSKNFDQGSMWTDPDNHCRSFSARFAVPSRILQKRELVG
uniref:Uncharacterized protein n=1 Tax=Fagus sylvatica TaxID=28930 RepID=A0A2N9G2K6_FAGSY